MKQGGTLLDLKQEFEERQAFAPHEQRYYCGPLPLEASTCDALLPSAKSVILKHFLSPG